VKVVGFAGFSGSGKTTLVEGVIVALKALDLRVSVIKHAHEDFDIDQPGKDSYRHRQAGALEVMVASQKRWALQHSHESAVEPNVHELLSHMSADVDWVLVEGFKHADLPKLEVLREGVMGTPLYPSDPFVLGLVSDLGVEALPHPTLRDLLPLNNPQALAQWLVHNGSRFEY
jgi:molybdopterin-guanine dinucleotide biosynthesis protein B